MLLSPSSSASIPGRPLPLDQPAPATWARADAVLLARLSLLVAAGGKAGRAVN